MAGFLKVREVTDQADYFTAAGQHTAAAHTR